MTFKIPLNNTGVLTKERQVEILQEVLARVSKMIYIFHMLNNHSINECCLSFGYMLHAHLTAGWYLLVVDKLRFVPLNSNIGTLGPHLSETLQEVPRLTCCCVDIFSNLFLRCLQNIFGEIIQLQPEFGPKVYQNAKTFYKKYYNIVTEPQRVKEVLWQ